MSRNAAPALSSPAPLTIGTRDWVMLGVLSIVWGGSYFFGKVAVEDIPPLTVVLGRVVIAAAILTVVMRARNQSFPTTWHAWQPYFVMGLLNSAVPYSLIFWGETRIASGLAAILTATVPIFTVILAHFWTTDERMTRAKSLGIALGMAGVLVIMGRDLGGVTSGSGLAKLAIIGATLSYAVSGIYGRRLKGQAPLTLAWGQMCAATVYLLPMVLIVDRPWNITEWHLDSVLSVISLAVFSTAIAYMLFFRLLANIGATNTSLTTFLIPISSLLLGFLFLEEALVPVQLLGMALIGVGMAVIDGRLVRRFQHPKPALAPTDAA